MRMLKLNRWYIEGNELRISLLRYYVNIMINEGEKGIEYIVKVIDKHNDILVIVLHSLESAISFVEDVINKSSDFNEIFDKCKEYFDNEVTRKLKPTKNN